jgi:radical SAM superfamily enzyme YgiQ (UPF0313 family)
VNITLATINARYVHSALALRWLAANLGDLEPTCTILEFVSGARTETLLERILATHPVVLGLSVYIWNVDELTQLVRQLKLIAPEIRIVLGGPEVSHETAQQAIVQAADYVITGAGELAFARLCRQLRTGPRVLQKVIPGDALLTDGLELPYRLYTDEDIAHRFLYIEASRGCPFKCEFCLSALDRTAVPFNVDTLLTELTKLYERGARRFKFVDRTFNLKIELCRSLLQFFLDRLQSDSDASQGLLLHFELVPDHLPEKLKTLIEAFPAGTLQFEIGIQTWNPQVQALISRRQDNDRAAANLEWLAARSAAHLHVDLIAGLPGESVESFGQGFDRLWQLRPQEIQVGILKRLRGAPISRHTEAFDLRFNPSAPYNLLSSRDLPFEALQRLTRFARYWDLIGNSGHFRRVLPHLLHGASAFDGFMNFSDWLYRTSDSTHRFTPQRLYALVGQWLALSGKDSAAAMLALDTDRNDRLGSGSPRASTGATRLRHQQPRV